MAGLAVVGGHNLLGTEFAAGGRHRHVEVGDATVGVLECDGFVMLQRHGLGPYVAPHDIDHVANARALVELGCDRVLAIASVGSLRVDWPVGTFLVAADFVALTAPPPAIGPGEVVHGVAAFDPAWRARVWTAWDAHDAPVLDGGVYWQTTGPRFETPAEIRLIAAHADVVGMTVASECIVAGELGLQYAALCMIDNLANGLGESRLSVAELEADRAQNAALLRDGLATVLPKLGAVGP
jgi:5'-methylthioinosine phosphorylase